MLLERWSRDYGFQTSNPITAYLSPRGLTAVTEGLAALPDANYAITGSLAAERLAPYAPPRLAMVYAHEPEVLATRLGLRPVDTNGNILISRSGYSAPLERLIEADGLRFVAPSQTAVDLLTGPGRAPAEAEALLDWMEANERAWRK
ncbi:MAG: hypothetical protein GEV11_29935 [Streptosporangiales bacterium]|nr:hypothetical protein [Streptosporangiales bacterium]